MTMQEVTVTPPNSLLLVMDPVVGVPPASMSGGLVSATDSCIAVGTLSAADGSTRVRLVDAAEQDSPADQLMSVWSQSLLTPSGKLAIMDVLGQTLLEHPSVGAVQVASWANDQAEPNEICVVVG